MIDWRTLPTSTIVAELTVRLNGGDFMNAERVYAPLARLILSEESVLYPELIEPPQEGSLDA